MRATVTVLLLLLLPGCERRSSPDNDSKAGGTPETGSSVLTSGGRTPRAQVADTVVRLVRRYVQQPAALQRVTGPFNATTALRPLDSVFAVRVLDNRGAELDSIAVSWTLANAGEGAALRVVDAATDSLGISRAVFTPGLSGDVQRVIAEVPGVARLEFPVTIAARAIRITPSDVTLWTGEDTAVTAGLRDADLQALAGGDVTWASSDTTTARVIPGFPAQARVMAVNAGSAEIFAFTENGKVRGATRVSVRPVVNGRLVTLDGTASPDMTVVIEADGIRETLGTRRGGFGARIPFPPGTDVTVRVIRPPGADFHDAVVPVGTQRDLAALVIALVPTGFVIPSGSYRGQTVRIDATGAQRRGTRGAPFWRAVPLTGGTPRKLLGWRESDYPLRLAFNRPASAARIDGADSVAFWKIADGMEADLGRDLFAPADLADSARGPIVRVEVRAQSSEGHTFVAWEQAGDAHEGIVILRDASTLRDAHVVTHELVHLIGFGHAVSWPSVSQAAGGTALRLTVEDVAHIQLAMRLRSLQEKTGARPGLP